MGAGSLLTGLAIYKPVQLAWLTTLLGGYPLARLEHFVLTVGYVVFFVIHITQVIRAGWNNFRAMVIGVEVIADGEAVHGTSRGAKPLPRCGRARSIVSRTRCDPSLRTRRKPLDSLRDSPATS